MADVEINLKKGFIHKKEDIVMKVLVVNHSEVRKILTMEACIPVMEKALSILSKGEADAPVRNSLRVLDGSGVLGMMPGYVGGDLNIMGLKVVSVFPGNHKTEYESHQGAVMIYEMQYGRPLAIIDAGEITATRTAAVSAVATKLLARKDAGDLALIGSGTQASKHLEAIKLVRDIRRVRVWSVPLEHAQQFAERESKKHGINVEVMETAHEAAQGADIICTVSASSEPVLFGESVANGAHINAVGACFAKARELDTAAVAKSRLYVDYRESTINEAGDYLIPLKEGAIGEDHIIGEIGDILLGKIQGRSSDNEITLYKSLGISVEDLTAAYYIYQKATEIGLGTSVEFGGTRNDAH